MNPPATAPSESPEQARGRMHTLVAAHPIAALLLTAILSLTAAATATALITSTSSAPGAHTSETANPTRTTAHTAAPTAAPTGFRRVDLGHIWGIAFRDRATNHEPLSRAEAQADTVPSAAAVNHRTNTLRFANQHATITIVANPPNGKDMAFRAAGLENPTIEVHRDALVTIHFINADSDSAHGWLLLDPIVQAGRTFHGPRAFPGAFAPILGDPTSACQATETIQFRATTAGTYRYECPVPGHAAMGMQGAMLVTA